MKKAIAVCAALFLFATLTAVLLGNPHITRAATPTVSIQDDPAVGGVFSPQNVTISEGDMVQWEWAASNLNPHSVTADDSSFDSDPPPPGYRMSGSFSHTFNTAGTYRYYCRAHGEAGGLGMYGTVVVQAAAATDTPTPAPTATNPPAATNTPVTSTTPGATQTPAPTGTPSSSTTAIAATPTAGDALPATAPTARPSDGTGAATQLPRTGGGAADDTPFRWLSEALAAAGLATVGAAFARRKRT